METVRQHSSLVTSLLVTSLLDYKNKSALHDIDEALHSIYGDANLLVVVHEVNVDGVAGTRVERLSLSEMLTNVSHELLVVLA